MGRIHFSKAVEILNNQFVNRNRQTTMMSYKEIERKRLYEKRLKKISKIYSKNTLKSWLILHAEDFMYLFSHSFSSKLISPHPDYLKTNIQKC